MENTNAEGAEGNLPGGTLDARSFEQVYKTNWKPLYEYALHKTGNHEVSQEVVQSVFVKLWEKRLSLKVNNSKNYLFMMVKNSIVDYYKQKLFAGLDHVKEVPDHQYSLFLDDLEKKFHEEIDKLDPRARQIFILSRLEGKPISEIAALLQTPQRTVEYHLARALSTLKTVFREFMPIILVLFCI